MLAPALRFRMPATLAALVLLTAPLGCSRYHEPVGAASPCPPWVDYPANHHSNDGSRYLGCTNRANLDQMLDDKRDVAEGRPLGPANGERESAAVKAYEQGKTKSSTSGGSSAAPIIALPSAGGTGAPQ